MNVRTSIQTVAVLGAGTMGAGIAQVFATAGRNVLMYDSRAGVVDHALLGIEKSLEKFVGKAKLTADAAKQARARLRGASMHDLAGVDLVVEAISEDPPTKRALWAEVARSTAPDIIFASNTSSISISELGMASGRPKQFIGMHFFNPVPLMNLVEVVTGLETDELVTSTIVELARQVGKTPHLVKDHPGFVSNRVLMPMINEAVQCFADGVADAETIDQVMVLGCNHPMGPLRLADLIGLDVCLAILEVLHRDLGEDRYRPAPLLRTMVRAGRLGRKSGKGFFAYERRDTQATHVEFAREGDVATLRFASPSGVNTLHSGVLGELGSHVQRIASDASIRFVVLRGTGKTFLAGADIKLMQHFTEDQGNAYSKNGQRVFDALESLPQPTFAALNGHTLGGGCELAIACDFRIAQSGVKLGQPESRLGLIPGWGATSRLPRLIGVAAARRLMYSGESITAEEALSLGLVDEVVPDPDAMDTALKRWFTRLAAGSPAAIKRIKHALLHRDETAQFGLSFSCSDVREGIAAFLEKRPPSWTPKA